MRPTKTPQLAGFGLGCRGGGIRTPGPREGSPVFKTGAINRSTTPLLHDFESKRFSNFLSQISFLGLQK